jgi:hypothetical protein
MAASSSVPASCGTWVAAATTIDPTMCHIAGIDSALPVTICSLANNGSRVRWLRCATQVVNAASLGRRTTPSQSVAYGSSGSTRTIGSTTPAQSMTPSEST